MSIEQRTCGDCTKCCEGWMYAEIQGQQLKIGSPCQYLKSNQGCSIYSKERPAICSSFQCVWLEDHTVPDWIKPQASGMISFIDKKDKILATVQAGGKMTNEYRLWTRAYAKDNNLLRPE